MGNSGGVYTWSKVAANNATADNTVNYAEGQAPSSLNDSARAAMTSVAKYRDDIAGAIITTGISTAYIVASNQNFDSSADMQGQMIAFTPHVTNTGACTLTVDGITGHLVAAPGAELPAGTIVLGTPYVVTWRNDFGTPSFVLHGFFGNPYNIPISGGLEYWGPTAPNSNFAFPFGQAISRTTYSSLFSGNPWSIGTTYGAGDGSTTFNLPDVRGRIVAGSDIMGGTGAGRLTAASGMSGIGVGAVGGGETETLTLGQIPTGITSNNAAQAITVTTAQKVLNGPNQGSAVGGGTQITAADAGSGGALSLLNSTGNNAIAVTSNNTGGGAHVNVQPTIVANMLIRII